MTKLEWCRENAPKAIQGLSDEEIVSCMSTAYEQFCNESVIEVDNTELNTINSDLDLIVLALVRLFGDKLAFKGGYMLTKLMPDRARQTTDVDFSIQNSELYRDLLIAMERIGAELVRKGHVASYKIKPEVRERMSGGMDMYDVTGKKVLGIDIGWHDITFGTTTTNINIVDVNAFMVERMLADKITAILSRKRFRRPKDIYDLYCITNCFDFDAGLVSDFILKRTEGAGAEWDNIPFDNIVCREYEKAYNKLTLQSIYAQQNLNRPEFTTVLNRFYTVCEGVRYDYSLKHWSHKEGCFI